jgi:hypothetical protein
MSNNSRRTLDFNVTIVADDLDRLVLAAPWELALRLAYQPPVSSTFLSEQTSHKQPANSTFLS